MELMSTIRKRRSIRRYKNIDVPSNVIRDLINSARLAPSAKNRQPWDFVVVKGVTKKSIVDIMLNQVTKSKISLERKIYNNNSSVKSTANVIDQASALILVFRPKEEAWLVADTLSLGAAIEHICLRATDLKLGSLWVRDIVYTSDEITKLVSKEGKELIAAIVIGYPDECPRARPRKSVKDIMTIC